MNHGTDQDSSNAKFFGAILKTRTAFRASSIVIRTWMISLIVILFSCNARAQSTIAELFAIRGENEKEIFLTYKEKGLFGFSEFKLETIIYEPTTSNKRLVIWSHGSMTRKEQMKVTHRMYPIAKKFNDAGYTFVIWMRAGRGKSEGTTEEFSGKDCDVSYTTWSLERNRDQLKQVIAQLKAIYGYQAIYLIGHSRGGMISANYASNYPDEVKASINLAGAYNQFCDPNNRNYSWTIVRESAKFKNQRWIYYNQDTFFGDAYKSFVKDTAEQNKLQYFEVAGNHATPLLKPDWIPGAIKWFEQLSR